MLNDSATLGLPSSGVTPLSGSSSSDSARFETRLATAGTDPGYFQLHFLCRSNVVFSLETYGSGAVSEPKSFADASLCFETW